MNSLREILDMLYSVASPSGYEKEMAELISSVAVKAGLETRRDALGNLIVHRKGVGKKCIIDAHMDTTGLVATFVDEDGFVRFDAIGGLSAGDVEGVEVKFLNGVSGVVSCEGKCDKAKKTINNLYIDIGAKDEKKAREAVLPGTAAVFPGKVKTLCGGAISAPYLDNRLGCAILLYTLLNLKKCEYDIYGVFSVQEEVGFRGAKVAAYDIAADFAIVLDVTDSFDTPSHEGNGEAKLSSGAAIKVMDSGYIAHPEIVSALSDVAKKNKIPVCREVISLGGTNGAGIHTSRSGIPTGGISVPVRYIHTPNEVASLSDAENAANLLIKTLESHSIIF
ncbi:MAG: M20/M25/M40 family metallo-hydrolase [Oscillospiraceae bacterium]|nr:M20/M25/M40 family metallo-hydrolase [Oscillospiraceae bacterium]